MRNNGGMRKLAFLLLMALVPVGNSCSRSLHGGTDAAPDGAVFDPGGRDAKDTDMSVSNTGGAAGGVTGTGGAIATLDASASGGATGTGTNATGGTSATGGTPAAGSTSAAGGVSATGGTSTGGASASGGTTAKGGVTAMGGVSTSGGTTGMGGSRPLADGGYCANIAGNWRLTGSCMGPGAWFNGSFSAVLAQTGCDLTFTQIDESGVPWVCTGRLESTGRGFFKGRFAFTDSSMCDIVLTTDGWDMKCGSATQSCTLQGREIL
jgi:hypothetical protein